MTRVLFVDDEPNVLAGLRRMLRNRRGQWDMAFAAGGEEALARMQEKPFDVIVSDMRMPGMDGAELLTRVQAEWPDTVRLVLSGQSDRELTLRAVGPAQQYLAKPCDPDALYDTVVKTCAVREQLASSRIRELVGKIGWLPALPETYCELVAEMNSPNASIEGASHIISRDVGMSAKVLKLINSSFFGLPVHVESVEHAAALLGLNVLRPLVLSSEVFRQFEDAQLGGFPLFSFVDHSLCTAMLARRIATFEGAPADVVDNSLLAGLMHDVGQIVIAKSLPSEYAAVCAASADADTSLDDLETEAFGATHAEVGGYLLSLWGLPVDLVEAVTLHHQPNATGSETFTPLTAVHAAEVLVEAQNEGIREGGSLDVEYLKRTGCRKSLEAWRACWEHPIGEHCHTDAKPGAGR
ncbi:MAG: response regulator [Planctomycetota bacterium]